jgi:hypothetical protein
VPLLFLYVGCNVLFGVAHATCDIRKNKAAVESAAEIETIVSDEMNWTWSWLGFFRGFSGGMIVLPASAVGVVVFIPLLISFGLACIISEAIGLDLASEQGREDLDTTWRGFFKTALKKSVVYPFVAVGYLCTGVILSGMFILNLVMDVFSPDFFSE